MPGSESRAPIAEAEALSFTVHNVAEPAIDSRRTRNGRLKMLAVLLVCAALFPMTVYYGLRRTAASGRAIPGFGACLRDRAYSWTASCYLLLAGEAEARRAGDAAS